MLRISQQALTLAFVALMLLALAAGPARAQTTQERVHSMSHDVMPFDMAQTLHIFKMTEQGGVLSVVTREAGASDQVPMIRQHLRHEATEFQAGHYTDPARLHGAGMPGLRELEAGAALVTVTYSDLPKGGQITFTTADLHVLTAIHRWFGAQLSEHGADAQAE